MKKLLFIILVFSCMSSIVVLAQNSYGLSDESVSFLNEFQIDVDIFAVVFNGEEDEGTLEQLERNLWSIQAQARAYGFNAEQVKTMVNSEVKRILNYRKVEYVTIPEYKVTFNGQVVDSSERYYPILLFRGITYFPMTYDDSRFMGVTTHWDSNAKKLTITKENVENAPYNDYKAIPNISKYIYESVEGIYGQVKDYEFELEINGKKVINSDEELPILVFRNITYFPITLQFAVNEFGWEYAYDEGSGLVIKSHNYNLQK